jgi:2-polyprenyl-3-methyl-5-hydroxy-6-metoxy-1,4-benzoquinol methylase
MLYRAPTDSSETNFRFYNLSYVQGLTTDIPNQDLLNEMLALSFKNTAKNFDPYIETLRTLGLTKGAKLFDFGCSWGYGSWQLAEAGYDVWASEISKSRADYARAKLGVRVVDDPFDFANTEDGQGQFDCVFLCHVLEHVPSPKDIFALAAKLLKYDGLFVSFTPNGSAAHRASAPDSWRQLWGNVHPNFIDEEFLQRSFPKVPINLSSRGHGAPPPTLSRPTSGHVVGDLTQYELIFVTTPNVVTRAQDEVA